MDLVGSLRRRARAVEHRLRVPSATVFYHRRYASSPSGLPMDTGRGELVLSFLARERLLRQSDVRAPVVASMQDLRRAHHDEYLESLHRPETLQSILGVPIQPANLDDVLDTYRLMVGGTIAATQLAISTGKIGVNLGGGFHHARPERGHGFCVYNDLAIAIERLRDGGFAGRVLVIDLDLHDGDGTRMCFADDPSVHTFSIHNQTWSDAPAREATVIALGAGFDDARYLAAIDAHLPPVIGRFEPKLVIYIAGNDPSIADRMGDAKVSDKGLLERDQRVLELVRAGPTQRPLAIVLGGGYGSDSWRPTARLLSFILDGEAIEPPDTETMRLSRMRYLARLLAPQELGAGSSMELDASDLDGALGYAAPPSRLLGYYTRNGVELALERYGLIDRLRALGFRQPKIELELARANGDLVRIYGDDSRHDVLVELCMRRDTKILEGAELLFVEWLLLQNPRRPFTGERPALPGQARPGLGLLADVLSLLVLICERLELDGIASVPAYYHLAHQGRPKMRFVDADAEAHYRALERAVVGLPLREASWAIDRGEVLDVKTGTPARWQPSATVFPLTDDARHTASWEAEVAAKLAELDYRLQR